jgi:hypothetical protein
VDHHICLQIIEERKTGLPGTGFPGWVVGYSSKITSSLRLDTIFISMGGPQAHA